MKVKYFYNDDNGKLKIYDEATLDKFFKENGWQAGLNWWDLGNFETMQDAYERYFQIEADSRYCLKNDC